MPFHADVDATCVILGRKACIIGCPVLADVSAAAELFVAASGGAWLCAHVMWFSPLSASRSLHDMIQWNCNSHILARHSDG